MDKKLYKEVIWDKTRFIRVENPDNPAIPMFKFVIYILRADMSSDKDIKILQNMGAYTKVGSRVVYPVYINIFLNQFTDFGCRGECILSKTSPVGKLQTG